MYLTVVPTHLFLQELQMWCVAMVAADTAGNGRGGQEGCCCLVSEDVVGGGGAEDVSPDARDERSGLSN